MEENSKLTENSALTATEIERQELIRLIGTLTEAVNKLSERLDNLEVSRQSRTILCPTIQISIPIGCYQRDLK